MHVFDMLSLLLIRQADDTQGLTVGYHGQVGSAAVYAVD